MFFGSALSFMLVYLWSKRNPAMQISLLGLIAFSAPYFPWVLLTLSLLLGHDITSDGLGIAVGAGPYAATASPSARTRCGRCASAGHLYYFLADVYPRLAAARGWRLRRLVCTPRFL